MDEGDGKGAERHQRKQSRKVICYNRGMKYDHGTTACYNHDKCRCDLCRAAINEYTKARARIRLEKVWELKSEPCLDCGGSFPPWVMQFDHRDPKTKLERIARMVTHSWKKVLEEVDKCDLVCANCHANRTYLRNISTERSTLAQPEEAQDTQPCGAE